MWRKGLGGVEGRETAGMMYERIKVLKKYK